MKVREARSTQCQSLSHPQLSLSYHSPMTSLVARVLYFLLDFLGHGKRRCGPRVYSPPLLLRLDMGSYSCWSFKEPGLFPSCCFPRVVWWGVFQNNFPTTASLGCYAEWGGCGQEVCEPHSGRVWGDNLLPRECAGRMITRDADSEGWKPGGRDSWNAIWAPHVDNTLPSCSSKVDASSPHPKECLLTEA